MTAIERKFKMTIPEKRFLNKSLVIDIKPSQVEIW